MDISLPVSDSPAAGTFSGGASARSADGGRFSQTLSREMTDQSEQKLAAAQSASAQQTRSQQQATAAARHADSDENQADADADAATENTAQHAGKASETAKSHKKAAAQDTAGDAADGTGAQVPTDAKTPLAGNGEQQAADAAKDNAASSAAADKTSAATSAALANGSANPALRGNAAQNAIFRNLRTGGAKGPADETGTYAESLLSGKSVQGSGKNLPVGKADKAGEQSKNFLPAGAQDWKYTADALITAVSDKAAKFDALTTQVNSQVPDAVSLFDTGTGKSLAAQSAFKNELAAQATAYTALTSDFPAGSEEWCQDFGTRIEWMSKEGFSKAELSLHPAELGALDITINTDDDCISISIVTHNEKSREMLESSMPRLTELLKSQGLALENSNISHNSSSNGQNAHPQQAASAFGFASEEQQTMELGNIRAALIRHHGQIDHYV